MTPFSGSQRGFDLVATSALSQCAGPSAVTRLWNDRSDHQLVGDHASPVSLIVFATEP